MFYEKAKGNLDSSWQKIDPDEPLRIRADAESLIPYAGSPRENGLPLQMVDIKEKNLQGKINQLHIFGNPAAQYVNRRLNTEDLRSDHIYANAKALLDECHYHHGSCGQRAIPVVPTRVLDLQPSSGVELKLYEPPAGELGEYIALSYCWGEAQPAQTTKQTLDHKLEEIDESTLPQSIQDAIFVTRKLGYRYLWVDSLCIIQDSDPDKISEISKMTNIYNNASLTIAASIATKASAGFLAPRRLPPRGLKLRFPYPNSTLGEVEVLHTTQLYDDASEPLNLRGWTMQERMLSRRLLIFGEHEITWQCQSTQGPVPITKTLWSYHGDPPRLPLELYQIDLPPHLRAPAPPNAVLGQGVLWRKFVQEYSRRQLSFLEDRFNAIGGIVQLLHESWKDEYLGGLWERNLLYTSLWHRIGDPDKRKDKDGLYLAPSWSWLSINAAVEFWILDSIDAELISCRIELEKPSLPFGRVSSGELTVRGGMSPASEALKFQMFPWEFCLDDGSSELSDEQKAKCMFFLIGNVKNSPAGLILIPVREGKYRRVGCFLIRNCPSWHAKSPFRYTASDAFTNTGKKKWICQVGRGNVAII
ncbi:hypothetical protein EG329_003212 [Mollisiaceae sp. DMI_Dod_QoI]|nr:hypothetical protein EG329_003212 [Helotiales sp. DMI_Dod_QoI]